MAAFDYLDNMHDVTLKPRLLQTLIRDYLPNEKHPFSNPENVPKVVSLVKTHSLLSESFTDSIDPKLIQAWKSEISSWVDRIFSLLSSPMPDKCWVGISLLGVTCLECSSDRFLESYSLWFQKLLSSLQSPAGSHLLRIASCASMSDLFARLSVYPKMKKDSSAYAARVVQPLLKTLHGDSSEAVVLNDNLGSNSYVEEAAVNLLRTIITTFPFSIRNHYDSVESAIAVKLVSGRCSHGMLKKLAHCLALLPRSKGDEESWSVMMQKILVLINDELNLVFQGLEEETMRKMVTGLLVLPGKHPLPPLGGCILAEEASNKASKRSEQSIMANVSTLLFGCCMMITNSYPVKVNAPFHLLLAFVERILMVNGSLPQISLPFITAKQLENICAELPVLHLSSLELLTAIVDSAGSHLLPHAAYVARIITKYFKTCKLPELRIKFYSVTKSLLISMGVGMALSLSQEVINNAFTDLSTIENKNGDTSNASHSNASSGALLPSSQRKRKHGSTSGSLQEHDIGGGSIVDVPKNLPLIPISLTIAALEAVEALITVAGALQSDQWRSKIDSLLIVIATDSFKEGLLSEESSVFRLKEPSATAPDLQFAALRALLASFLSFAQKRPPYLAEGLELFCRGKEKTGTKLAEFCAHALLTLDVLIHPRALPLADYSYANNNSLEGAQHNIRGEYFSRNKSNPYDLPDYDDDLCTKWLENANDIDASMGKGTKDSQEPSEACRVNDPKEHSAPLSPGPIDNIQEGTETATCADVEMQNVEDGIILPHAELAAQFQEPFTCTTNIPVAEACADVGTGLVSEGMPHNEVNYMESGQGSLVNKDLESSSQSNSLFQRTSDSNNNMDGASTPKFDFGSSVDDDFPDIVDGDPDSDSE